MSSGNANPEAGPHQLRICIHGSACGPTIVYLPGLHGDWTLIGTFRKAIGDRVRFIEVAYPDTLTWSLEEHAVALETELKDQGLVECGFWGSPSAHRSLGR